MQQRLPRDAPLKASSARFGSLNYIWKAAESGPERGGQRTDRDFGL